MKLCKIFIILFASLLCLTFSAWAQGAYTLLKKGERSPYDTAVAIRITEYRALRAKFHAGDSLIYSLNREVKTLYATIVKQDSNTIAQTFIIATLTQSNARKDQTIQDLNAIFKDLEKEALRPRRRGLYFGLGALATTLTLYTGSRLWPNR